MAKKRTKEAQAEYMRAYRAKRVTPDQNVTPGREVLQVHQAAKAPPLAHVDPTSPLMSPYRFVPNWVTHNLGAPSNAANEAWQNHVANTIAMTGRTPGERSTP